MTCAFTIYVISSLCRLMGHINLHPFDKFYIKQFLWSFEYITFHILFPLFLIFSIKFLNVLIFFSFVLLFTYTMFFEAIMCISLSSPILNKCCFNLFLDASMPNLVFSCMSTYPFEHSQLCCII